MEKERKRIIPEPVAPRWHPDFIRIPKDSLKNYHGAPLKKGQRLMLFWMRAAGLFLDWKGIKGQPPEIVLDELNQKVDELREKYSGKLEEKNFNQSIQNLMMSHFKKKLGDPFGVLYMVYVWEYADLGGEQHLTPEEKRDAEFVCRAALQNYQDMMNGKEIDCKKFEKLMKQSDLKFPKEADNPFPKLSDAFAKARSERFGAHFPSIYGESETEKS